MAKPQWNIRCGFSMKSGAQIGPLQDGLASGSARSR
jgi:hypothetical protein